MARKPERGMPSSERAKQFSPFSALRGLEAALKEKERIRVPKRELSDDMADEVDRALRSIGRGDIVTAVYYFDEDYRQITGVVSAVDSHFRCLWMTDVRIPFDDVYSIVKGEFRLV